MFPNNTEIATAASTLGVDPIEIYAYAAMHGVVPSNHSDLTSLETAVASGGNWGIQGDPSALRYGYIQSHGSLPPEGAFYVAWGKANGFLFQNGAGAWEATGQVPGPGDGYPPGNAPTDQSAPTTTTTTTPSSSGVDLSGLVKNPLVLGGAALAGAYALGIIGHRNRR